MADWENRLGQESPLTRALRLAMPEDLRNPLLHPEAVNHFALPPQQPRAELRNLPPRPGDYMAPVSEAISPTMGAYGLGNALGDVYNKGREGDYKGMASPLAEILLSMAPVPGMKKGAMPPRVENPIRAYHGSPHDFDKFDLSKIGTGEGAQAYGHGMYFAENEGVAKSYKHDLSPMGKAADGRDLSNTHLPDIAAEMLHRTGGDRESAIRMARNYDWQRRRDNRTDGTSYQDVARVLEQSAETPLQKTGHMYEVAIHATPDQFLDWDKPLSQQPSVQSLFKTDEQGRLILPNGERAPPDKLRGESLYRAFAEAHGGGTASGSQALRDKGLAGIEYFDQGSRGAGEGTKNRVVFDPDMIEILRKYGLLGPIAAGATANALMGDKDQQ